MKIFFAKPQNFQNKQKSIYMSAKEQHTVPTNHRGVNYLETPPSYPVIDSVFFCFEFFCLILFCLSVCFLNIYLFDLQNYSKIIYVLK